MGGPTWGPSGWAHVGPKWVSPRGAQVGGPTWGPKWVGPRGAQVGGPKLGPSGPKPEIWDPKKSKKIKFSKSKSLLPKMSTRSGLVGEKSSWAHLGPSGPILCVGGKNPKNPKNCLFPTQCCFEAFSTELLLRIEQQVLVCTLGASHLFDITEAACSAT